MVIAFALAALLLGQASSAPSPPGADLVTAARLADLTRARELVAKGVSIDTPDIRGFTPLMWASAAGHLETVRYLLENGARVDAVSNDGSSALMLAAANGASDIVQLLLVRGAN